MYDIEIIAWDHKTKCTQNCVFPV